MSTEQSVDPELVEETKQQIRNLVREIAQLSKSELTPIQYYDAFLNRVVSALAAVGGAIWIVAESGGLELAYQINLLETHLADSTENQNQHGRLLRRVMTSGQAILAAPHSGATDEDEGGNPTDFLLVLNPLKTDQETKGIVEVFQRPGAPVNVQKGYSRFLTQMCDLAGDFLKTRQLRHFNSRQVLWSQLENFTRIAHRSLDPRLTAYTIANEGRRLIDCDRVSVAIRKGRKCIIEAVSGQDTFDKRSNTVSMLARLATAVTATGEPVWYTGDTSFMAPQVEDAVQAYVDEAHSKTVAIIPLRRPQESPDEKELSPVIGALIVEQIEDSRPKEGLAQRIEVVSEHSATALANALEHNDLFLMPVWRALGKAQWVLKARTLPKTIAILSAVVGAILFLTFWPADFELQGDGKLQPEVRREVFAPIDGTVIEVDAAHGQMVEAGQRLALLRNNDLQVLSAETLGKLEATKAQIRAKQQSLAEVRKADEMNRLNAEIAELKQQQFGLEEQCKLLEEKRKLLKIVAPIRGQVINPFHIKETLLARPVKQGQVLMGMAEIGQSEDQWELEILMPEDRMGHVARHRLEHAQTNPEEGLTVTYILHSNPGRKLIGHVVDIHEIVSSHGEEGNSVLVRVAVNKNDLTETDRKPGVGVTAKIDCGRASLGYVLFHDVIAFIQSKILFRFF